MASQGKQGYLYGSLRSSVRGMISRGTVLCLVSASGFGLAPIFAGESYAAGIGVSTMLAARFTLAALVFWAVVAWRRPRPPSPRVLLVCVALGAVGYACQAAFYFGALTHISASLVSLLLYAYPALVTALAIALRRESLDRRRTAALALSGFGLLLLLGTGGLGGPDAIGVLLGLGAALAYALYLTVAEGLPGELDLYLLSAIVCTGAAVSVGVWALQDPQPPADPAGWGWVALLAVFSTVVPIVTMFAGVRAVGASGAAILSCAEPAVTVASTALVYGEPLVAVQIAGGAAVLAASFVLNWPARRTRLVSERPRDLEGVTVGGQAAPPPLRGEVEAAAVGGERRPGDL